MSVRPNHPASGKAGIARRLTVERHCPGRPEPGVSLNVMMRFTLSLILLVPLLAGCGPGPAASESCVSKLRQIDGAKEYWAEQNHKATNDAPTWEDLRSYMKSVPLVCPNGGTYTLGRVDELPTCSIPKDTDYWKKSMGGK